MKRISPLLSWGILLLLALVWGSSFILIKRGLDAFNPFELGALRMVIAGLCLLPFGFSYFKHVPARAWKPLLLVGLLGNGLPAFLFPLAEQVIGSASTGILNTLTPIFVLVLGVLYFGLPFSGGKLVGVVLGLLGSVLLIVLGEGHISLGEHVLYSAYALLGCIGYAISSNITKAHLNEVNSIAISAFSIISMAIPYLIYLLFVLSKEPIFLRPHALASLGYISILAVLGTVFALILFYRLVQLTDPVFTASVTYLIPIVAVSWGLLDGEQLSPYQFIGMGVILLGVYLTTQNPAKSLSKYRKRSL